MPLKMSEWKIKKKGKILLQNGVADVWRALYSISFFPPTEDVDDWLQRVAAFSNKPSVKTNESYSDAPDLFQDRLVTPWSGHI